MTTDACGGTVATGGGGTTLATVCVALPDVAAGGATGSLYDFDAMKIGCCE